MGDSINNYISNGNIDMEKIIKKYRGYIKTIIINKAREYLTQEDIEEVISDVFINIWHNKERIIHSQNLKKYIAGITINVTNDKIKRRIKNVDTLELEEDMSLLSEDVDIILNNIEINNAITEELNELNETEYKIFAYYYYLNLSTKQIANRLNMSEVNVRVKLHRIREKLKFNLSKKGITAKTIIAIIILLLLATSFVTAKIIIEYFFKDASKGVKTAVDNGYIYETELIENSSDVDIQIEKIIMDDYSLNLMFNIKLPQTIKITEIKNCNFSDLFIVDENDNWLVTKFQNEKSIIPKAEEIRNMMNYPGLSNGNETSHIACSSGDSIKYSYITNSNRFPKSRSLNIQLDQINLEMNNGDNITINGYWLIDVNLPEDFYNRKTIVYNLKSVSDSRFNFEFFTVSKTGSIFMYTSRWNNPDYDPNDDKETYEKKFDAWLDNPKWHNIDLYRGIYVENENGEVFYQPGKSDSEGGTTVNWNGTIESLNSFELTEYSLTDKLWIHLKYTKEYYGEDGEVIFELERNK